MPVVRLAQFKRTPPQSENLHRKHDILREKEGLSAYHPQHWGETRVVQFHSDHPLWGVLYGIAANPYLLFFRREANAVQRALDLESYRIFGGVLHTERDYFAPVRDAVHHYMWNRTPRIKGVAVSFSVYIGGESLAPAAYREVEPPRQSFFAEHELIGKYLHVVPVETARQLGGVQYQDDVTLDLALLSIWGKYTAVEQLQYLTPRERQLLKLWKKLPKPPTYRPLTYHADAPRYG
jgi:hypothetical protein